MLFSFILFYFFLNNFSYCLSSAGTLTPRKAGCHRVALPRLFATCQIRSEDNLIYEDTAAADEDFTVTSRGSQHAPLPDSTKKTNVGGTKPQTGEVEREGGGGDKLQTRSKRLHANRGLVVV